MYNMNLFNSIITFGTKNALAKQPLAIECLVLCTHRELLGRDCCTDSGRDSCPLTCHTPSATHQLSSVFSMSLQSSHLLSNHVLQTAQHKNITQVQTNKRQIWKCTFSMKLSCLVAPTLGLLEVTEQARKASLYVRSRTPKAFKPRTPSVSYPSAPFTRVEVSALAPEK